MTSQPTPPSFVPPGGRAQSKRRTVLVVVGIVFGLFVLGSVVGTLSDIGRRENAKQEARGSTGGGGAGASGGIAPGVYLAKPDDVTTGAAPEGAQVEFEIVGTGEDARVEYVVGFGLREEFCDGDAEPSGQSLGVMDDEPVNTTATAGKIEGTFESEFLTVLPGGGEEVTGDLAFGLGEGEACGGLAKFTARRQPGDARVLYARAKPPGS